MKLALLSSLAFASSALSISLMLPLYIYPLPDAWDPVYSAITANPKVTFLTIVNVDSGPGGDATPPSDYAAAIAKLNTYSNVRTIGYVPTNYTNRPYDKLTANITKYGNWPADIKPKGIFFDEGTYSTDSAAETYMKNAAAAVRSALGGSSTVVFNPGTTEPEAYFGYADYIVDFEGAWSDYSATQTPLKFPQADRAKSAIIVHDTPSNADLTGAVETAKGDGIGAIYFTDDCCYNDVGLLGKVAAAFTAAA